MGQFHPSNRSLKFSIEISFFNIFSTVQVTEHWHRWPRGVVESPPLKIFQSYLDMVLGNLFWVALLEQRVGPDDPQRFLPTSTILLFN